ncbi:MAG: MBL fold metallo-hydrolase [Porticoccus sp.]|jgi:phosphoribosyl 1,2-cyclic phosphodiesterase|nr:MBL fold metallo-hydrolase [Porticoccus sp.]|tara:strand:+ start:508 stop:1275 length:768 start_codon:yes stop_codon:yes gene_type:complete
MRFSSIGSGSKGNSTLVEYDSVIILVDCGFSVKEAEKRLNFIGIHPSAINCILVTHEHSDHIRGVSSLAKKYNIPVMATPGTSKSLKNTSDLDLTYIETDTNFCIKSLRITPVTVPHDAREPVQFIIKGGPLTLGILTDTGTITQHIIEHYQQCDGLLIESNHDENMLTKGIYPESLKERVGGDWGHLNNKQTLYFLKNIKLELLQELVIGHISENNNSISLVKETISEITNQVSSISYATQNEGFNWKELKYQY